MASLARTHANTHLLRTFPISISLFVYFSMHVYTADVFVKCSFFLCHDVSFSKRSHRFDTAVALCVGNPLAVIGGPTI